MSDDVKELLGKAFGQEPPLGIDRDEVLREGRKRLRRRRYFASGGVVAAVVVAAVGAATLTNLAGSSAPERMPPAGSSTMQTTPSAPTQQSPPKSEVPPPESTRPPKPPSQAWANELTVLLHKSGHVPEALARPVGGGKKAKFWLVGDKYVYKADIIGPKGDGYVEVTVEYAPGRVSDCKLMTAYGECSVRTKNGVDVLVGRQWKDTGETTTYTQAVLPDGSMVTATSSNLTSVAMKAGRSPNTPIPVLDDEALCDILVKSGLRAG
jgi:hypothetical protein